MGHTNRGCPSIRAKALSRQSYPVRCLSTAAFAREVEDQDSGNLTRESLCGGTDRSTNHRFGLNIDHDSAMRTSRPVRDARAPNQFIGLACADQGHPRAALDANDLWIRLSGCAASSRVVPPTCAPPPPWPRLSASDDSDADTLCETAGSQRTAICAASTSNDAHQSIALLGDRAQLLPSARTFFARNQSQVTGHLLAPLKAS